MQTDLILNGYFFNIHNDDLLFSKAIEWWHPTRGDADGIVITIISHFKISSIHFFSEIRQIGEFRQDARFSAKTKSAIC